MTSTFRASDLKSSTVDTRWKNEKWTWTPGSLRHVIKVLGGQRVAIEADNMTGWTIVGATLGHAYGDRVDIHTEDSKTMSNPSGLTRYFMPKIGVIIGLEKGSKYDAIESERREHELARLLFAADFPVLPEGKLEVRSTARGAVVSHTPKVFSTGRYQYREYSLDQIQAASPCDHCVVLGLEYDNLHEKHCPVYAAWHAKPAK